VPGSQRPPTEGGPPPGVPRGPAPDEFAGIRARPTRHPVLAAITVALAAFLVFQIRDDVRYALSPARPRELGDARGLARAAPSEVPVNRYVRLTGLPDRESGLILDAHGSWAFTQFFRLLGTDNKVFVRRAPDPLPVQLAESDVFTGRLLRFHHLSFDQSIRRHLARHVSATHFFDVAALEAALGRAPLTVTDRLGEAVTLAGEDELAIDTARRDEVTIEVPAARLDAARAALRAQGGEERSTSPAGDRVALLARLPPARRDAALAALSDLDRRVRIGPARTTTRARVSALRVAPDGLAVSGSGPTGQQVLPRGEIQAVRTMAPVVIPDDAWLLVEGERPRDHLRDLIVAVFLAGFALINLLAVRRA
jgi:hypothetical protein